MKWPAVNNFVNFFPPSSEKKMFFKPRVAVLLIKEQFPFAKQLSGNENCFRNDNSSERINLHNEKLYSRDVNAACRRSKIVSSLYCGKRNWLSIWQGRAHTQKSPAWNTRVNGKILGHSSQSSYRNVIWLYLLFSSLRKSCSTASMLFALSLT